MSGEYDGRGSLTRRSYGKGVAGVQPAETMQSLRQTIRIGFIGEWSMKLGGTRPPNSYRSTWIQMSPVRTQPVAPAHPAWHRFEYVTPLSQMTGS